MYRNFICYRGGSSGGFFLGKEIYDTARKHERILGKTYFSVRKEDPTEIRNFMNDPGAYLADAENFVIMLTNGFFKDFIRNDLPYEESVTRIEIDEALKNKNMNFIVVLFPDFSWDAEVDGKTNREVLRELWGDENAKKIYGAMPIAYTPRYEKTCIEEVIKEIDSTGTLQDFKLGSGLVSSDSIFPKKIFYGRENTLQEIKDKFDSGERIIFLQGIGGIGKTEIAKQYVDRNKDKFDTIVYATYTTSIMDLILGDLPFKLNPPFPRQISQDGVPECDLDYFKHKLEYIKEITDDRTLVIVDNYDVEYDEHFEEFVKDAKYKLLITTRCDYHQQFTSIKIEPLDDIKQLKSIFLEYYQGFMVDENDEHLEELINLVNRHTYAIELIAQHMENSGQTTLQMIDALRNQGIVSLNESVRPSLDKSQIAYEIFLKIFKVFNLSEAEKKVLQVLSFMPLSGVNPKKDFCNWTSPESSKVLTDLNKRSWIFKGVNGIALHPIVRDVVRYELPAKTEDFAPFFNAFNETIKEEKSWHFSITEKGYYADIANELISIFKDINEYTAELYRNTELLLSFSVKPAQAIEIGKKLYKYYLDKEGENSFMVGYFAFQIGWTYLFNFHSEKPLKNAEEWFDISYKILNNLELKSENDFAVFGHLLTHISRVYLIKFTTSKDKEMLENAKAYASRAITNAQEHFGKESLFYSRHAVAYMQLAEAYIANAEYSDALKLVNDAYEIMVYLFGEKDPDTLNVSSRRSWIYYCMGQYDEALEIGKKNVETYTEYYGELHFFRFEQLVLVLKCYQKMGDAEQIAIYKEKTLKIARQLLASDSPLLKELNS